MQSGIALRPAVRAGRLRLGWAVEHEADRWTLETPADPEPDREHLYRPAVPHNSLERLPVE